MAQVSRRNFLVLAGCLLTASAVAQTRSLRIGVLSARQRTRTFYFSLIVRRLAQLGYVEGKNLVIEFRSSDDVVAGLPSLARELVNTKCDLAFAIGPIQAAQALIETKAPFPIILVAVDYDPLRAGIVSNLARPGGNVTGVFFGGPAIAGKRLGILHNFLPNVHRVLVLEDPYSEEQVESIRKSADELHIQVIVERFATLPYDIAAAFMRGRAAGAMAMDLPSSPVFADQRTEIAALALQYQLPIVGAATYADIPGFLVGFGGTGTNRLLARAADMAVEIVNGRKPADVPLEQPTEFETIVNLRTAKAMRLDVPHSFVGLADRVIE